MNMIRWAAIAALLYLCAACSSKPPGCADEAVVGLMRSMLLEDGSSDGQALRAADTRGIASKYLDAAKVTLSSVVSEGYQADAKRQSCKATVRMEFPDGQGWEKEVPFSTQLTVDGKGQFVLEAEGLGELKLLARKATEEHYLETRWAGLWSGTYSCGGLDGEADGPRGPFSMPVQMLVEKQDVKLERVTAGGGVEELQGRRPGVDGKFSLQGRGRNAGDDLWEIAFEGQAEGEALVATGTSKTVGHFDVRPLRKCSLRLVKGDAPEQRAAALPGATNAEGWPGTYSGTGDGEVTLEVKPAGADKRHPVAMTTSTASAGGGCGGAVEGFGTASGDELRIVAESDGQRCEAVAKRSGNGIELEEGAGCNFFHGAACGFSASLTRKP